MSYQEEIKERLKSLKPELSAKFHVSAIGLFGSVVRDDFFPETSDIDIRELLSRTSRNQRGCILLRLYVLKCRFFTRCKNLISTLFK
jgi:predicted nucleotidyltransferase